MKQIGDTVASPSPTAVSQYICNHFTNVVVKTYSIFRVKTTRWYYTEDGEKFLLQRL